MKVLWITNIPIGEMANRYGVAASGLWMDVVLQLFKEKGEHKVIVATPRDVKTIEHFEHEGVAYYMLPGANRRGGLLKYKVNDKHIEDWKYVIGQEKPDVIMLWGTEFLHGLAALKASTDIPSVIYVQGLLESIGRQYGVGLLREDIRKSMTLRSFLIGDGVYKSQKQYLKRAEAEKEIFSISKNAICENKWCESYIKRIDYDTTIHKLPLDINDCFSNQKRAENIEQHSIICNAVGYPIKGLHILLRALYLLKKKYPDVKLYVPGSDKIDPKISFWEFMKKTDYHRYCAKLINEFDLNDNIVWLGRVNQDELAIHHSTKNVFVLASTIENHSASLKEAMMVGLPCVASYVGGVPEYVNHGENGFLYQSGEYEMLAYYVDMVFSDSDFAKKLGEKARNDMIELHKGIDNYAGMVNVLENVIKNKTDAVVK